MSKKHKPKRKAPQPSRLEKAQAWFSYLAREYKAIGVRMVNARLEFLEADAEERAKLHLQFPDDEVIKNAAEKAAQDLHDWNVKMGRVQEIEETENEDGTTAYRINPDGTGTMLRDSADGKFLKGEVIRFSSEEDLKAMLNAQTNSTGT